MVSDRVHESRTHSATWISISHSHVCHTIARHSLVPTKLDGTKTSLAHLDGLLEPRGRVMIGR